MIYKIYTFQYKENKQWFAAIKYKARDIPLKTLFKELKKTRFLYKV